MAQLERDGEPTPCHLDEASILKALHDAAEYSETVIGVRRDDQNLLQVALGTEQPMTFLKAEGDQQHIVVPDPPWPLKEVSTLLSRYATADPKFDGMVSWRQNHQEKAEAEAMAKGRILVRKLAKLALAAVAILLLAAVAVGKIPLIGALKLFAVVLAFGAYLKWLGHALRNIVPRVKQSLERRFEVSILEVRDFGWDIYYWKLEGDGPTWLKVALSPLYIALHLLLILLPFAVGLTALVFVLNDFSF